MRAELRPSSLGEILDRTAQMYRSHFMLYFGIAGISYAGVLALNLLLDVLFYPFMHSNPRAYAGIRVVVGAIVGLLAILPVAIAMAAVMHAVARNYLGQPATIREAYANIRHHWYRYILILLAMYVYSLVPLGALMGIVVAAATLVPPGAGPWGSDRPGGHPDAGRDRCCLLVDVALGTLCPGFPHGRPDSASRAEAQQYSHPAVELAASLSCCSWWGRS